MDYFNYSIEEKAAIFDVIAGHYYQKNFGQMSKSDMDLLMFHFYIEKMISSLTDERGSIDYSKCSDYRISKELGITQQRVRNLKVKNQLVYPIEFDWKTALAKLINNARYDAKTGKVVLSIPDPNLYIEIQNFIEEQGAHVERQLNGKLLQLRPEYFIDLMISLEPEKHRKAIIKHLKELFRDSGKDDNAFDEQNIGKSLVDAAVNVTTVASNLSAFVSPQNQIGRALLNLLLKNV